MRWFDWKWNHIRIVSPRQYSVHSLTILVAGLIVPLKLRFFSESPRQIVVYCRTGSRSAQVCRFLNQQSIHNVINMRGGIAKWTSAGHSLDREPSEVIA